MKLKKYLDELVKTYETEDFIKDDPVQFPHRFVEKKDIEIAGFLASLFAYGKREVFISKLNELFEIMNNKPLDFVISFSDTDTSLLSFNYRFSVGIDLIQVLLILRELYSNGESLESLFAYGWNKTNDVKVMLQIVVDYFYSKKTLNVTQGFYHLLPNPSKNSACKRMNMFLRWMVRDGLVDLGLWSFMPKSELLIPLDTHVAKISRELGLLDRAQNDYSAVVELSKNLKEYDSKDPIKYDFAMFGVGINS